MLFADDFEMLYSTVEWVLRGRAKLLPQVLTLAALDERMRDRCDFDILLLDLIFAGTLAVSRIPIYLNRSPQLKIVVFTADDNPARCHQCLAAGATGFVSKCDAVRDLLPAIEAACRGQSFVSEYVAPVTDPMHPGLHNLGIESIAVLRSLRRHRTHAEIAAERNLTLKGVEYHVRQIKRALNLPSGHLDWGSV